MSTELADERALEQRILSLDRALMKVVHYELHGDLVCPTEDILNREGPIWVPASLCAKHKTPAGIRRFFEFLVQEKMTSRIMREIEAEKRRQNTSTCNYLLQPVCVGAIAMFVFCVLTI
jgi:hypothetical protein